MLDIINIKIELRILVRNIFPLTTVVLHIIVGWTRWWDLGLGNINPIQRYRAMYHLPLSLLPPSNLFLLPPLIWRFCSHQRALLPPLICIICPKIFFLSMGQCTNWKVKVGGGHGYGGGGGGWQGADQGGGAGQQSVGQGVQWVKMWFTVRI